MTDTLLTTIDTVVIDSTNIEPTPVKPVFTWKYYPNPTSGKITIELSQEVEELFITDISGKIILRDEPKTDIPTMIDLSPYPTGIYFIRFQVDGKPKFGRVLLNRSGVAKK